MKTKKIKNYPLDQSPLYKLTTKRKLAELLCLPLARLKRIATLSPNMYNEWTQEKKNGDLRTIEDPARPLKMVQSRIAKILSSISAPEYLHCPVKGKSYISNAAQHIGSKHIRNVDISNYFPSTKSRRVYWFFHNILKCSPDVAGLLTTLTTYKGHLPCGSPSSSILAYYAHYDMWQNIYQIVSESGCKLSVYMDDVTVSGGVVTERVMFQVRRCIYRSGLQPKKEKERWYRRGIGIVTGIVVRSGGLSAPNAAHLKRFKLRNKLATSSNDEERITLQKSLRGIDGQQSQIDKWNRRLNTSTKSVRADLQ
ncbi:Reverse transcriptase (RNA-dependent DNA polymerase) [Azospirillum oryzae]|uniref:Reverse transcriptase (RNA-dependent DNA polymerase) n=1 Tax=Azospirillum oryzae TaxID=286727 RepID=A0A1X7HQZ2_9PROT|nr:reverse transcriptase family protein [Azospirillum oryzae]SMF91313.1 Reverse transcriptase (RNA-dependent DNA polymerase) [Azospirillum oryzae]